MSDSWDVVIVGAGPAGAAAAIRLRDLGFNPLVLEADRFPREHVGESLVGMWSAFELLGVAEQMDATFQHKHGSCRIWGKEPDLKWTVFGSLATDKAYSLQVERATFDSILLRRAEELGVTVLQGHRALSVIWRGDRAVGLRYREPGGRERSVTAPWIIDASGRSGLIAKSRGLRAIDDFFPDLSVYGYFADAALPRDDAGNLLLEAVPWGWFWFIPLHTGEISVGLVCDRSSRDILRRLKPEGFLRAAIAQSKIVRQHLDGARLVRDVWRPQAMAIEPAAVPGPGGSSPAMPLPSSTPCGHRRRLCRLGRHQLGGGHRGCAQWADRRGPCAGSLQ